MGPIKGNIVGDLTKLIINQSPPPPPINKKRYIATLKYYFGEEH